MIFLFCLFVMFIMKYLIMQNMIVISLYASICPYHTSAALIIIVFFACKT